MLAIEVAKDEFTLDTIDDDSRQYDHYTGKLLDRDNYIAERKKELDQVEFHCVIRRVKKSEAIDATHVRMKEIRKLRYEFEEFVHRKVDKVIEEIEQVKLMEKRDDTSQQRQIDHVITDMDELIYAHQEKLNQIVPSYGCCLKLMLENKELHDCGRSVFAMEYS